jgi:tetratricopeptide (TPR) repeat protein
MSYINEALKKAQEERDSRYLKYNSIANGSDKTNRLFSGGLFWPLIMTVFLIFLLYGAYAWLAPSDSKIQSSVKPETPPLKDMREDPLGKGELYEKASNLIKLGRFQEAKKLYEAVASLDPGYVEALNNLGVIYIREGDFDAAKENLEKAVRLNPKHVESYYNMACLYAIKGEAEQGLEYLKKAVSLDSNVREWARNDSDLQNLKSSEEFIKLIVKGINK